MSHTQPTLEELRTAIDAIDAKLLGLISERAGLAKEVAKLKDAAGEGGDYYRPDREAAILRALRATNRGPLSDDDVERLFREVISACRALERPMRIAYLGPAGTFSEAAALKHFGHAVATIPLESIEAVFREVESENSDYGVVPVENSTEGIVNHTLDMFVRSALTICGEAELAIHQNLLGRQVERGTLSRVYSHQQTFAQCRRWLDVNLAGVEQVAVSSNGEAARRAAGEAQTAAIAGQIAAQTYGLDILAANIEDEPDNTTRFLVIGRRPVSRTGADKTSLLLSSSNRPGSLFHLLETFERRTINMTRIESRPARSGVWEYVFFIDIEGHIDEGNVAAALAELAGMTSLCKVLGSYPRAAR